MKHAGAAALQALLPLLRELRRRAPLFERSPGVFYLRSKAFLHFHEDPTGTYADVRLGGDDFTRLRATSRQEQAALVAQIDGYLAALQAAPQRARAGGKRRP